MTPQQLYDHLFERTSYLLSATSPPEVASTLITQGLSIYKTFYSDEDYKLIVEMIAASADDVRKLQLADEDAANEDDDEF